MKQQCRTCKHLTTYWWLEEEGNGREVYSCYYHENIHCDGSCKQYEAKEDVEDGKL